MFGLRGFFSLILGSGNVMTEEAMMQAGVLGDRPRVDELIYLFGIFRAARVPADVKMQRNEWTVQEAVDFMRAKTPWLDENVARVDAEIYLRRPPGSGIGTPRGTSSTTWRRS